MYKRFIAPIFFLIVAISSTAQKQKPVPPLEVVKGTIIYHADSVTGDRIPDFSYCGYKASEEPIPMVPVKAVVPLTIGDATHAIQLAIDDVAKLPIDPTGFRGAVLLQKGVYKVEGSLSISVPGIVLRGSGVNLTTLLGTGVDRETLIKIAGKDDRVFHNQVDIIDSYVPVNAQRVTVSNGADFKKGDHIIIKRPSTQEWIDALGTRSFGGGISTLGWKPGDADIVFDRVITAVTGNVIEIDAPITTSLDKKYGTATVQAYEWKGRLHHVGVENLLLQSDYDKLNPKDENHRWMAITIDNAIDAWVRQVEFKHFAGSAVFIGETVSRVTVEDCISQNPVSEIGGQRRYTFFTRGQQTLFQHCYARNGYHDFATGHLAAGPNAFVQCYSSQPYQFSGGIDKWASGILFDDVYVDGNAIRLGNRGQDGQGAGWAAANSVLWNCSAARIDCYKPPTAQNWSFGSWSQFAGDGYWAESNNHIEPRSLFYAQLAQRLHKDVSRQAAILGIGSEASSSPSVEAAQQLTQEALKPRMQMDEWIRLASKRNPIDTTTKGADIKFLANYISCNRGYSSLFRVENGFLTNLDVVAIGKRQEVPWWSGGTEAADLEQAKTKLAITRFVPGRQGPGLTDNIEDVVHTMQQKNIVALEQHYALWYERRRDDHERIRRMDGEVWPPFYELPFARSGKDTAWDGLSKYDLTKYNPWYWGRLKEYATTAGNYGLLLFHSNYFQHNIIEAGAHYADFPWRTANNINNTGLVEPVNYAGEKRIFYAQQFYDLSNPIRKKIHEQYIRKCLDNFKDNTNVVQFIGEEFTGPVHFVKFWLQTIADWEKKNGKQLIALSVTKDVQDAILNDKNLASVVDVIDIKYWHYQADGTVYAPEGGKNLAPRQWARLLKPKPTSFEQVYRAVKEYRTNYPGKAVLYSGDSYDKYGWAVLMAGGSVPVLPSKTNTDFLAAISTMQPVVKSDFYELRGNDGLIVYYDGKNSVPIDLSTWKGTFKIRFISATTGMVLQQEQLVDAGSKVNITVPPAAQVIWVGRQ